MIIDAHNHPSWEGMNLERYLDNMARYGIDRTWLMTWDAPADEYNPAYYKIMPDHGEPGGPLSLKRCVEFAERVPDKFVLGYAPDPRKPDAIDRLQMAIDLYGVKLYGELKLRMMYDNPDAIRMFRFCGEKGLPVLVHIDYEIPAAHPYPRPNYWYGGTIGAFERAVKACPETVFIGHAPGFWSHISDDDQYDKRSYPAGPVAPGGLVQVLFDRYPNLYADLSSGSGLNALKRDPAHAREFVIRFQDRLLYGRDCFHNEHQQFLNELDLPDDVLAKVYAGNALRLIP
ncbi:hypothetical protein FE783_13925 [Paenibacillus mesophilus]|uniref:amidohydrolase family protein n=1 Tax=Paenibacillus mesophilus TaxID=2582849 RepID=UPI00110F2076|nr:amidohydrolase family protein [Paenibacillus mesophilus]TMV49593.1 hypothetical protein FE783_13925 [Paenibacillus mesophilus]